MTASKAARKAASLRKGKRECRHVRLYAWELESHAYRSLGLGARCLLVELKALYNGANNGSLHMSIREAPPASAPARIRPPPRSATSRTAASSSLPVGAPWPGGARTGSLPHGASPSSRTT